MIRSSPPRLCGRECLRTIAHAGVSGPPSTNIHQQGRLLSGGARELSKLLIWEIQPRRGGRTTGASGSSGDPRVHGLAEEYPDRASSRQRGDRRWAAGLDQHDRLMDAMAEVVERRAPTPRRERPLPTFRSKWSRCRALVARPCPSPWRARPVGPPRGFPCVGGELRAANRRTSLEHIVEPGPELPPSPHGSQVSLFPPPPIPPGRSRLSKSEIAGTSASGSCMRQRWRPLKGLRPATIADITGTAGVDRRVFYNHFHDKQQAFSAFTSSASSRLWRSRQARSLALTLGPSASGRQLHAAGQFQATNPIVSHMGLSSPMLSVPPPSNASMTVVPRSHVPPRGQPAEQAPGLSHRDGSDRRRGLRDLLSTGASRRE